MGKKQSPRFRRVTVLDHPVIQEGMTILRSAKTPMTDFRDALHRLSRIIALEALKDMRTSSRMVVTPLSRAPGSVVGQPVVFLPILRAGLGLLEGFLDVYPKARVGHIGLYRDEATLQPVEYYGKLPSSLSSAHVVVLDPMLATGGSASAALTMLKTKKVRNIVLASVIAAPEGIARIQKDHREVRMVTCAVDKRLNMQGYIVPGLGDAGDRLYGT